MLDVLIMYLSSKVIRHQRCRCK